MKKIIIRTPNFIGDTINTTPCLELIKQELPGSGIYYCRTGFCQGII